jgi:tRNA (cytidine/uridine-2'-O-)-methyltransferase
MALHVCLLEPEIHWNTGNAGRTCLGAGASLHLVKPLGFPLTAREIRRSGLDYWERVRPRIWESWEDFEGALPALGDAYFLSPEAPRSLFDVVFTDRVVLVFGRESTGLPGGLRERHRERLVAIPMRDPGLRGLNLSTSVAVAAYEVLRQQRASGRLESVGPSA